MLTTNQVPFITQVSVIPYGLGYESAKYLLVIQHKSRLTI